jgi:hypothetical protein
MDGDESSPHFSSGDIARVQRALARIGKNVDLLKIASEIRSHLGPELGRFAALQVELRRKATDRFPSEWLKVLTRKGLEQATRASVARERAHRIARVAPGATVVDATCGLGSDSIACVEAGLPVLAFERDARTAACARANLEGRPGAHCVFLADAETAPISPTRWKDVFWLCDPDRRASGTRSLDVQSWSPSLARMGAIAARVRGACWKLTPAIDIEDLVPRIPPGVPHRWQWVSVGRELCELAVWWGRAWRPERKAVNARRSC